MPRKPRNKIAKKKIDFFMPLKNLLIFGSENDPCFAKLYSPSAPECQSCGDSEICLIAQSQRNRIRNEKLNKKENFKDMEDVDIEIVNFVKNLVKTNHILSYKKVVLRVQKHFSFDTPQNASKAIKKAIKGHKQLTIIEKDGFKQFKPL